MEVNTKKVSDNKFETTRKVSETKVISNTKEIGDLKNGESLNLSKQGQQVAQAMTF